MILDLESILIQHKMPAGMTIYGWRRGAVAYFGHTDFGTYLIGKQRKLRRDCPYAQSRRSLSLPYTHAKYYLAIRSLSSHVLAGSYLR